MIASDFLKHYRGRCPFGSLPDDALEALANHDEALMVLRRLANVAEQIGLAVDDNGQPDRDDVLGRPGDVADFLICLAEGMRVQIEVLDTADDARFVLRQRAEARANTTRME